MQFLRFHKYVQSLIAELMWRSRNGEGNICGAESVFWQQRVEETGHKRTTDCLTEGGRDLGDIYIFL